MSEQKLSGRIRQTLSNLHSTSTGLADEVATLEAKLETQANLLEQCRLAISNVPDRSVFGLADFDALHYYLAEELLDSIAAAQQEQKLSERWASRVNAWGNNGTIGDLGIVGLEFIADLRTLEDKLSLEIESRNGWRDAWTKSEAKLEAQQPAVDFVRRMAAGEMLNADDFEPAAASVATQQEQGK